MTLTDDQDASVYRLYLALTKQKPQKVIIEAIQKVSWLFLSITHPDVHKNEWKCPVLRHIVAIHLNLDGSLADVRDIPPYLSKLQYVLRLIGISQSLLSSDQYECDILG